MRHRRVVLSKLDVRLFQPGVADVPPAAPAGTPTFAHTDTAHTVNNTARTDAPPPVHTDTTLAANTTTSIERSATPPPKGKHPLNYTNDPPSPY